MITEQQVVVTTVLIVLVGLIALFLGMWWGVGKERERSAKELDEAWDELEREQAKARRTHSVYRIPGGGTVDPWHIAPPDGLCPHCGGQGCPACDARQLAHEDPATVLDPTAVLTPEEASWTGEIQRMTADFERDMERILGGTDKQLREITR